MNSKGSARRDDLREHAPLEREDQLTRIAGSLPCAIFTYRFHPDGSGFMPFATAAAEELFGISRETLARDAAPFLANVHPLDARRIKETARHLALSGSRWHEEYRYLHPTKGLRWIEGWAVPQAEPDGSTVWHGFAMDVTDRKRTEAEREASERRLLIESEGRFRAIFEQAAVGVAQIKTTSGEYVAINDKFCDIVGYSRDEMLARTWQDLTHPDDLPSDRDAIAQMINRHESYSKEKRYVRKDGSIVWVYLTVSPMWSPGEAPTHQICVAQDITAQRQLEAQYLQAQKLESVGRLAGGIAHDFNNLLTVIQLCGEELRSSVELGSPAHPEDVEQIRGAAQRAGELTRQLLAFARKQVIAPVAVDLNGLVRSAEKLLRRVLGEDVELRVTLQPDLWRAHCDPGQVEQVIFNLAVNGRDAMPKGGALTLATSNVESHEHEAAVSAQMPPGQWVRLTVRDTGSGMSDEVKEHLFEPFFTTKAKGAGTGLGLATVYGIVDQAGGHIHVRSEMGRGTTFEICLPRTSDAEEPTMAPPRRTLSAGAETLLLVEDDPQVREVTARSLRAGGYRVLVAADGVAALAFTASELGQARLLVTDVIMPGLDGRSLAAELSRRHPELRVLYVSGYPDDAIAHHGVLEQGVEFLAKPFTTSSLLARVRAVLDGP
jgi:two-component system, cell cycle sensor histidine kinase and response regulator CckA